MKKGILLLNLGTPDTPEPKDVGRYLKEFLMDKWVVDIPAVLRWFLVHVMIVPKRQYASSEAYRTIWTERGSPLLFHLQDLAKGVRERLAATSGDDSFVVSIAMRYGKPSIETGLRELLMQGVDEIVILPLYPQYAESSTRSSIEMCREVAEKIDLKIPLRFVPAFYEHSEFIESYVEVVRESIKETKVDHWLMSFHGLPERHVKRTDRSGGRHCLAKGDCCARITEVNRDCYRAQCYATARALAARMGLRSDQYTVSFQSRLGRTPWIRPFTDEVLTELPRQGHKRLAVICPAFAADCLETLEEIKERGAADFKKSGGEFYQAIPCLNSHPRWVEAVTNLVR